MSIRSDKTKTEPNVATIINDAVSADAALGEGNSYCVATPDNPLKRNVVVSIRASLNDLCLSKSKGTWAPSTDALNSIFQQKKFTSLDGSAEVQGDLKSMVLHDLSVTHVSSNFPISLGAKFTGVDDTTFSSTGEAYSLIGAFAFARFFARLIIAALACVADMFIYYSPARSPSEVGHATPAHAPGGRRLAW
jgi:hypothetical protein